MRQTLGIANAERFIQSGSFLAVWAAAFEQNIFNCDPLKSKPSIRLDCRPSIGCCRSRRTAGVMCTVSPSAAHALVTPHMVAQLHFAEQTCLSHVAQGAEDRRFLETTFLKLLGPPLCVLGCPQPSKKSITAMRAGVALRLYFAAFPEFRRHLFLFST